MNQDFRTTKHKRALRGANQAKGNTTMTTQKNRWQEYSAALQNDLCSLRDAIELIHVKHSAVRAIRLSFGNHAPKEMAKAEQGLKNAVDAAVKIARSE